MYDTKLKVIASETHVQNWVKIAEEITNLGSIFLQDGEISVVELISRKDSVLQLAKTIFNTYDNDNDYIIDGQEIEE